MVNNNVETITDPVAVRNILAAIRGCEEQNRRMRLRAKERELFLGRLVNEFHPGTFFGGSVGPNAVVVSPPDWVTLKRTEAFPLPPGHRREYCDLQFDYTIDETGQTFDFITSANSLLDLRFRQPNENNDANSRYGKKWILVGIPTTALDELVNLLTPHLEGYQIDTSNFRESNDRNYVVVTANLNVDPTEAPRFVQLEVGDGGTFTQDYLGDLDEVYEDRESEGIHKAFLIFDPYLVADIPDQPGQGPHQYQLKFRLIGIRSLGANEDYDLYFPRIGRREI